MNAHPIFQGYQRQIHLDFHTSPYIPGVGSEFNAREFAKTMKKAAVNSVTLFAKCHHGMSYYPTKVGRVHPSLQRKDLMGEMIEALHREGIRAPIYTTIVWEEEVAKNHPEWRQMTRKGAFAGWNTSPDGKNYQPGMWRFNSFINPDYQDYIEAHLNEILDGYEVDGFFLDILFFAPGACWSEAGIKFREKHGLMSEDVETQNRFEFIAQREFAKRFTKVIHAKAPKATIFYNASNPLYIESGAGLMARMPHQTHWEVESLPSGFWGYFHFPRLGRFAMGKGMPWMSMTGRFQKMWGDFGGLKPQPALEFECFRSQAMGGANSVGDQLPPRGTLDAGAYDLIGSVYRQCAAAEPFYAKSEACPQVGILSPNHPKLDGETADKSLEGAVQMVEESHYDAVVLDESARFDSFELLMLPDSVVISAKLAQSLKKYVSKGGKLILSHRAGFDAEGKWALGFLPLSFKGETESWPTYWRIRSSFMPLLSRSDRVFYDRGVNVVAGRGVETWVDRVPPYFKRSDWQFSSHFQTPPVKKAGSHPTVVAGKGFVYFADPIFREYRQAGNIAARDVWREAIRRLIGAPWAGEGLPSTVLQVPRRKGKNLLLTLMHYVPVRKSLDIDMIEERMGFAGEALRFRKFVEKVRRADTGEWLKRTEDGFVLPPVKGRLLLEVPSFFSK